MKLNSGPRYRLSYHDRGRSFDSMTHLDGQLFKGLVLLDVPEGVAGGGRQPRVDVEDGATKLVGVRVEADLPFPSTC